MPRRGRSRAALALALLLSTAGGCLAVRTPEEGEPVRLGAGEGVVFGRVRAFELGLELTPWDVDPTEILAEDPVIRFSLLQVESGRKRPNVPVQDEGRFEWILPAGTYLLYHTPSVEPPFNEPLAAFQVPRGSDPIDLRELRLDVSVDRPLDSATATYSVLRVEASAGDAETERTFLQRHPGTSSVRPGAFVVDPELGGLFTSWSRDACARILARHGITLGAR